jgi:hypothetical protein
MMFFLQQLFFEGHAPGQLRLTSLPNFAQMQRRSSSYTVKKYNRYIPSQKEKASL